MLNMERNIIKYRRDILTTNLSNVIVGQILVENKIIFEV